MNTIKLYCCISLPCTIAHHAVIVIVIVNGHWASALPNPLINVIVVKYQPWKKKIY